MPSLERKISLVFFGESAKESLEWGSEAGIEFVFPTQTIFLASDPKRGLTITENTVSGKQGEG